MTDPGISRSAPAVATDSATGRDARPPTGRDRNVRWIGLAGAVSLAVAGYLGGALPDAITTRNSGNAPLAVALWLLGTTAMVGAWWALRGGAPSTRWAYVTAGLWALPLLVTAPLGSRDVYSYACQGWVYADGGDPYVTGVGAAGCPWLDAVAPVWRDTPAPYGPFFVLLAALAVLLGGGLIGTVLLLRLLAVAGLLAAAACLPGLARAVGVPPRRAVWLLLACPLVGVHLVAGAHNDAVMLGLLLPALLLVTRRPARPAPPSTPSGPSASLSRPSESLSGPSASLSGRSAPLSRPSASLSAPSESLSGTLPGWMEALRGLGWLLLAGVLLGLAVSVKVTAVVVVPFAALAAVRGRPRVATLLRDGGPLLVGVLGGLVAPSLLAGLGPGGWLAGLGRSGDTVQWTSPSTAVGMVVDYAGDLFGRHLDAVPVTRAAGLLLLAAFLLALWHHTWSTARRTSSSIMKLLPRKALTEGNNFMINAAGVGLAATVVLSPVFHPWYATWPLAVLAVAATRTTWFVLPAAVVSFLALPDGTNVARLVKAPGAVAMTVLVLAAAIWALGRSSRLRR